MAHWTELEELMNSFASTVVFKNNFLEPWKMNESEKDSLCRDIPLSETYMREFAKYLEVL